MTQEEKAKACDSNYKVYTELINRLEDVKDAIKKQNYGIAIDILCKPYPEFQITTSTELAESEDEKIRKELITHCRNTRCVTEEGAERIVKWISWLEKQGNLMKALQISNAKIGELIEKNYYLKEQLEKQVEQKMKTPEESLGIDSDTYNKIVDECVYGEQKPIKEHNACEFCEDRYGCVNPCSMKLIEKEKPADKVEPKFKVGQTIKKEGFNLGFTIVKIEDGFYYNDIGDYFPFTNQDDWELVEQKSAWSEEDRDILFRTISDLKFLRDTVSIDPKYAINIIDIEREITWLNSLRPQNKTYYWTENEIKFAISDFIRGAESYEKMVEKLRCLKPQTTWKPSGEQMNALNDVISSRDIKYDVLSELWKDLKKLMDEDV